MTRCSMQGSQAKWLSAGMRGREAKASAGRGIPQQIFNYNCKGNNPWYKEIVAFEMLNYLMPQVKFTTKNSRGRKKNSSPGFVFHGINLRTESKIPQIWVALACLHSRLLSARGILYICCICFRMEMELFFLNKEKHTQPCTTHTHFFFPPFIAANQTC